MGVSSPATSRDVPVRDAAGNAELTALVGLDALQRMQNRFAALGQVSVCICTPEGFPLTTPSWGSRFSQLIGTSPSGRQEIEALMRRLSDRLQPAHPYVCLDGMTLYATGIEYEGRTLGLIVVGTRPPEWAPENSLRATARKYGLHTDDLVRATRELDANIGGTPEAAHRFADGLAETIATIYGQAARIQRQLADLRTVHELADLLSGTFDVQEILDVTVNRVVKVLPVKACGIRLLDENTGELVVKAVCNLSEEYLRKGPVLLRDNPIDGAAFAGETVYIADVPNDPRIRYPENARREGLVSGLSVPMTHRGQTVGVLRVYTDRPLVFTEAESALVRSLGSQAAAAILSTRLMGEKAEAQRVRRQLIAAGQIQRRMLPARAPRHPKLTFGAIYAPTLDVGGDLYDFIEFPSGGVGVCIADVAGKGIPAALMMASVRAALRQAAHDTRDVAEVIRRVNRHLCRDTLIGEFTTLFYGVLSADGQNLEYCNAGHTPPLLLRGDRIDELTTGGIIIGIQPDADYDVGRLVLEPGDVLAMTTDGISEAISFQGEVYGRPRVTTSLRKHRQLPASELAGQILWDVRRFVGLAEQSDDATVVVIRVHAG
jgi:sigma-B regulation protein RsbU (phosphoserine phosphatase)